MTWCEDGSAPLPAAAMLRAMRDGDVRGDEVRRVLRRRLERVSPTRASAVCVPEAAVMATGAGARGG